MLQVVNTLPPYCYPIDYSIDRNKLNESLDILLARLGISRHHTWAFNLTHLPEAVGDDRWNTHTGSHRFLIEAGIDEVNFTELLDEVKDLYLGQIIQDLYQQHNGLFRGRCQVSILPPKRNYGKHIDKHTPARYHIPLVTNTDCYWEFHKNNEIYKLYMPADNKVWYFDPINVEHDFYNNSNEFRWHLILASSI